MDVVTPEEAHIAEDAGAVSVATTASDAGAASVVNASEDDVNRPAPGAADRGGEDGFISPASRRSTAVAGAACSEGLAGRHLSSGGRTLIALFRTRS